MSCPILKWNQNEMKSEWNQIFFHEMKWDQISVKWELSVSCQARIRIRIRQDLDEMRALILISWSVYFIILISDIFHFLTCRDFCCHFEINILVINKKIRIAADFMIDEWNYLLNVFNQLLNFMLLSVVYLQLVFIYWESSCKDFLICSYQMCKLN